MYFMVLNILVLPILSVSMRLLAKFVIYFNVTTLQKKKETVFGMMMKD